MDFDMHWINGPAPGDDPEEYAKRARYRATDQVMAALRQEMKRQGMLDLDAIPALKLERAGDVVTPDELQVALLRSTNDPAPSETPIEEWRKRWETWLEFLTGALNYGGFRLDRLSLD